MRFCSCCANEMENWLRPLIVPAMIYIIYILTWHVQCKVVFFFFVFAIISIDINRQLGGKKSKTNFSYKPLKNG